MNENTYQFHSDSTDSIYNELIDKCRVHPLIVKQFEVVGKIGKGGFGTVLKVRNKTDCKFYALKLIPLSSNEEEEKLTREVKVLASLNHENVIHYNTSWIIEADQGDAYPENEFDESSSGVQFANSESEKSSIWMTFEDAESSKSSAEEGSEDIESSKFSAGEESGLVQDKDANISTSSGKFLCGNTELKILCIQMEYCEQTLKEFIDKGNHFTDQEEQNRIIREILEGVQYIHNQGVMHRDLKPTNIFLDKFGKVKIGDFGFARHNFGGNQLGPSVPDSENNNSLEEFSKVFNRSTSLTQGLGTYLYRSPEIVLNQTKYDNRVDLYSLGIIIFELCYKFSSETERCKVLECIRGTEIFIPNDFDKWSNSNTNIKDIIVGLLQHNPEYRTSICSVRESLAAPDNEDVEENQETESGIYGNDDSAQGSFLELRQSIGCIRTKGKPKGFCFRVGSKYVLTTYTVIERILKSKFCSVAFLNYNMPRKNQIFHFNAETDITWKTPENNLAILDLSKTKGTLPPPFKIGCIEKNDDTLALLQVIDLKPFRFEVRLLTEAEFTKMDDKLLYFSSILPQENMGSPVIRMSENGSNSVCGMVLAHFYAESQKTGTCVIDGQNIYECFSPTIPFDLRRDIFEGSTFYHCHENLMIRIELLERELKKLKEITDKMITKRSSKRYS